MKNVKYRGIPRQKDEFRGSIPRLNTAEKPKFRGTARNSAGRGQTVGPNHQPLRAYPNIAYAISRRMTI